MSPRALWKGWLKVAELSCPVALHTAVTTSERIAFQSVSRKSGLRLRRELADSETGAVVPREDQIKGYETDAGDFVEFEPEEIAELVPDSDKMLAVEGFVPLAEVDPLFFDRPYFLAPADRAGAEVYALIREGLRAEKAAALARTVLFRRLRNVLVRADDAGLTATTLAFDYEIRSPEEAFNGVPKVKVSREMLDLAKHIIAGKAGSFDPAGVEDRYEDALAELVRAKLSGKKLPKRRVAREEKVVDLMEALRASAGEAAGKAGATRAKPSGASDGKAGARAPRRPTRKAG